MRPTQRRTRLFRYPLFRLLAINLAAGTALAASLGLDPGGLRHLIFTDRAPGVALGLLLFGFMVTLGSTAMGSAIMALGQHDADDGDKRRGTPSAVARDNPRIVHLPPPICGDATIKVSKARIR